MRVTGTSLAAVLLTVMLCPNASHAQRLTPRQQEVWNMEDRYWHTIETSNLDAYVALWHPDFIGWPRDRDLPVGKAGIADGARKKMADGRVASHEILSRAVSVVGDVGVAQYAVRATRVAVNGDTSKFTSRVTHTWLKRGRSWRIISGMSAPIESSQHTW